MDFRREIRPIAFVEPGAFTSTDLATLPTRRLRARMAGVRAGPYIQSRLNSLNLTDHGLSATSQPIVLEALSRDALRGMLEPVGMFILQVALYAFGTELFLYGAK